MILRLLMVVFLLMGSGLATAVAQTETAPAEKRTVIIDKRKLLVQPRNADGTIKETAFTEDPVLWMRTKQQNFYGRMSIAIRQLKSGSKSTAAWTLLSISFLYGVFHAAGPGHGKAVVTGWLLATENELKRGLFIAFLSALIQALTAIVVVSALLLFVSGASAMARDVASFLESASYMMIAVMGLYLVWNGWTSFQRRPQTPQTPPGPFELVSRPEASDGHIHDENCGHAHAPAASDVRGDWSLSRAFAMAFAVGIRPCSGAILVLVASNTLGLYWAGVASTLAMGFGVFLTIAFIASLAVYAKSSAIKFVGVDNPSAAFVVRWGKMVVGLAIAGFGALLFLGSLGATKMVI